MKRFKDHIRKNGFDDGKFHLLVFDSHASYMNIQGIEWARSPVTIELFQFPSHSRPTPFTLVTSNATIGRSCSRNFRESGHLSPHEVPQSEYWEDACENRHDQHGRAGIGRELHAKPDGDIF